MSILRAHVFLFLSGLAFLAPGEPARAQFFTLDGFGNCIDQPEAKNCRDRLEEPRPPVLEQEAPQPADENAESGGADSGSSRGAGAPPGEPQARQQSDAPKPRPAPSLDDIFQHIQTATVSEEEMGALEHYADSDDPRAVEVLAWCYFAGRGRNVDLVKAYRLYGKAASLNIPNATKNQSAIFAQMTGAQRNEVASQPPAERKP